MFSQIKAMIKEKRTFQESADLILKDTIDSDLDDMIILGESTNIPMMESEDYDSPEMESDDHDDDDDEKEEKDGEEKDEDGENDLIDQKIDDDHDDKDDNSPVDYSILDDKMDDNENEDEPESDTPVLPDENQPSNDDLMNSPMNDPSCDSDPNCHNNMDILDDILNVDIDIRSNTVANTIPVAPNDAQSAVAASSDELSSAISRLNQNLESARSILDDNIFVDDNMVTESADKSSVKVTAAEDILKLAKIASNNDNKILDVLKKCIKDPEKWIDDTSKTNPKFIDNIIYFYISNKENASLFVYQLMVELLVKYGYARKFYYKMDLDEFIRELKQVDGFTKYNLSVDKEWFKDVSSPYIRFYVSEIYKHWDKNTIIDVDMSGGEDYVLIVRKSSDIDTILGLMKNIRNVAHPESVNSGKSLKKSLPVMKESAEPVFSLFDEAISLGDDSATSPEADGSDTAPTDDGTENKVTAAVRDKVNDTAPDADMGAEDDTNSAELSASSDAGNDNKDKLLKKLSDITKNLEDAKKAIMDNLS